MEQQDGPHPKPQLVDLPVIHDPRGNLTFVEADRHIPFPIRRTYHIYDVPGGSERGAHAHRRLHQFIMAMSGSFDVNLDSGSERFTFGLNRSYYGVYVPPMHWRVINNFSSGAVCMVLASEHYDETDYIRDYGLFLREVSGPSLALALKMGDEN